MVPRFLGHEAREANPAAVRGDKTQGAENKLGLSPPRAGCVDTGRESWFFSAPPPSEPCRRIGPTDRSVGRSPCALRSDRRPIVRSVVRRLRILMPQAEIVSQSKPIDRRSLPSAPSPVQKKLTLFAITKRDFLFTGLTVSERSPIPIGTSFNPTPAQAGVVHGNKKPAQGVGRLDAGSA